VLVGSARLLLSPIPDSIAARTAGVRQEQGQDAVEEACEGLVLLHEQVNRSARYWSCPTCDQKFNSGREFLTHVELAHEEVAVQVRACEAKAAAPWGGGGDLL